MSAMLFRRSVAIMLGVSAVSVRAHAQITYVHAPVTQFTDVSANGQAAVGINASNQVVRWDASLGAAIMPPVNGLPNPSPCASFSAFIAGDGSSVVGHIRPTSSGCFDYGTNVYRWVRGQAPVQGSTSLLPIAWVKGCTFTGDPIGDNTQGGFRDVARMVGGVWTRSLDVLDHSTNPCQISIGFDDSGSATRAVSPDGTALVAVHDCGYLTNPGVLWRTNPTQITRLNFVPLAASNGAWLVAGRHGRLTHNLNDTMLYTGDAVLWSERAGEQPIPGMTQPTDMSYDGQVVIGFNASNDPVVWRQPIGTRLLRDILIQSGVDLTGVTLVTAPAISGDGRTVVGQATLASGESVGYLASLPPECNDIDFNNDGIFPDTEDINTLLCELSGGDCCFGAPPGACDSIDFNNDSLFPDTLDIDALLSVFSGGPCLR